MSALLENFQSPLGRLLFQFLVIILATRLVGSFFKRFGQPAVIGEITAGILIGPSLFGWVWSDGRELYYHTDDGVMAVRVGTQPVFKAEKPKILFRGAYFSPVTGITPWDIDPGGKRFLMLKEAPSAAKPAAAEASAKINIVVNWLEELKQRVPMK